MKVFFIVRLIALMCEIKSMDEIIREFNTIAQICGLELEEIPHCDKMFEKIKPEEIIKYMINKMLRKIDSKKIYSFLLKNNIQI